MLPPVDERHGPMTRDPSDAIGPETTGRSKIAATAILAAILIGALGPLLWGIVVRTPSGAGKIGGWKRSRSPVFLDVAGAAGREGPASYLRPGVPACGRPRLECVARGRLGMTGSCSPAGPLDRVSAARHPGSPAAGTGREGCPSPSRPTPHRRAG